jgi:hypothetical protein
MPTLEENLGSAEASVQAAQVVKPDANELDCIKKFCAEEVAKRARTSEATKILKGLRASQKMFRESLLKELKASGEQCFALSKADAKRLDDECAKAGRSNVPRFVRNVQSNKDSSITPEIIQESLESLTSDDLNETNATGHEAIKAAILQSIRRSIRSFTENAKLMSSLPRGQDTYDVVEASATVSDLMYQLWTTECQIKDALESKKQDPEITKAQNCFKETIEGFFVRTGLTAQRLVVEGLPYRLVRRVSVRKPKIGIGKLEKMLDDIVKDLDPKTFKPNDLIRSLQIQLSSMPPEMKTCINLCSVKAEAKEVEKV